MRADPLTRLFMEMVSHSLGSNEVKLWFQTAILIPY